MSVKSKLLICFFIFFIQFTILIGIISLFISQFKIPELISQNITKLNYSILLPINLILLEIELELEFENKNLYILPIQNTNIFLIKGNEKIGFIFLKSGILQNKNKVDASGYIKSEMKTLQSICTKETNFIFQTNILFFEFSFNKNINLDCNLNK